MNYLKKISFLPLLVLIYTEAAAQTENIDSLKKVLPSLKDTARIDCLIRIFVFYHSRDKDSAIYYSSRIEQESRKLNYLHGVAESYITKGAIQFVFYSNYPGMENCAREALKRLHRIPNKTKMEVAYWQLGAALFFQNRYEEAAPYLEQAYYWAEKNNNKEWMYNVLGFKYENYRDIGEYDKAFDAFQKTQQLNLKFDGKIDSLYEYYVLAELQRRLENYSTALNYYHKVIARMDLKNENIWYRVSYPELFALSGQFDSAQYYYSLIDSSRCNRHDLRFYLVSLGEFYLLKKDFRQALQLLLKGIIYHREANDRTQINRTLLGIAKSYAGLHEDEKALSYTREALEFSLLAKSKQYIRDAYQLLYQVYQRKKSTDSAFAYYQKYVTQKEIVANDVVKGQFAAHDYKQQIQLLGQEKLVQQQELKQTAQQRTFLIIGIAGLFILGLILVRNIYLKRKNEASRRIMAENELQIQKLENEKTKAELEQQATELEMQALRAQMNPHFIFNSLNSINRFILQNNKQQASEYLTKFSRLVRMILQNSQAPLITLESELEALKLYLDLEALRFEKHFEYKLIIPDDVDIEVLKVPPLIIQPYAENAIWHGLMHKDDKGLLEIEVSQFQDQLVFRISDDGVGRKTASKFYSKSATLHKSMGLKITAARIAMLQGSKKNEGSVLINDLVHPDGSAAGTEVIITIRAIYSGN